MTMPFIVMMSPGAEGNVAITPRQLHSCKFNGFDIPINGKTWDIKTQATVINPQPYYRYSVEAKHIKKTENQGYIFNSILADESTIIPVGYIPLKDFVEKAHFHPAGTEQWEYKNGLIFEKDTYNVAIHELSDIDLLLKNKTAETQQTFLPV